jgi:hypothetical protein
MPFARICLDDDDDETPPHFLALIPSEVEKKRKKREFGDRGDCWGGRGRGGITDLCIAGDIDHVESLSGTLLRTLAIGCIDAGPFAGFLGTRLDLLNGSFDFGRPVRTVRDIAKRDGEVKRPCETTS